MVAIRILQTHKPTRLITHLYQRRYSVNAPKPTEPDHRASSKLFEDAAKEEAAEATASTPGAPARLSTLTMLENQNENWTGDESIQHAVLRMLVDKYKPLRSGPIRSADEKLKAAPPKVGTLSTVGSSSISGTDQNHYGAQEDLEIDSVESVNSVVSRSSFTAEDGERARDMANVPLLPSVEGHQPWHTTFQVPSHATSSVKYGHTAPSSSRRTVPQPSVMDEKAMRKAREAKKRTEQAGRLSRAKESTLDYRLSLKGSTGGGAQRRRPNPVTMKGWASLVEDRIEKARLEGQFNRIKGRGQPLQELTDEKNPFIAREEFLMNRIVQRNGAAPPWVEIQGELEQSIASFREVLRQSWTRRAIRMLTISHPQAFLSRITLDEIIALRDAEWETRERAYHDTALEEVNSIVRKYNTLAPYAVRKPYYMRGSELEKAYRDGGEDILRGLAERIDPSASLRPGSAGYDDEEASGGIRASGDNSLPTLRIRDVVRQWISNLTGSSWTR